jgi:hypothetical protein
LKRNNWKIPRKRGVEQDLWKTLVAVKGHEIEWEWIRVITGIMRMNGAICLPGSDQKAGKAWQMKRPELRLATLKK